MKPIFRGEHGKPSVWPIPRKLLWTPERYSYKNKLRVRADETFSFEAEKFFTAGSWGELSDGGADLIIEKCGTDETGDEGYVLTISEDAVSLKAASAAGVFYGLQTLGQIVFNSPGPPPGMNNALKCRIVYKLIQIKNSNKYAEIF